MNVTDSIHKIASIKKRIAHLESVLEHTRSHNRRQDHGSWYEYIQYEDLNPTWFGHEMDWCAGQLQGIAEDLMDPTER